MDGKDVVCSGQVVGVEAAGNAFGATPRRALHNDMHVDPQAVEAFYERRREIEIPTPIDAGSVAVRKLDQDLLRRPLQKKRGWGSAPVSSVRARHRE